MTQSIKSESKLSAAVLRELRDLRAKATSGEWSIDRGFLRGSSIYITTWWRKNGLERNRKEPICHIPTENVDYSTLGRETRSIRTPIKTAEADAELICKAVNLIDDIVDALLTGATINETAWLIEYRPTKHNPIRYYCAGSEPVLSASDATRFSRKQDADATMRALKIDGASTTEHMWLPPSEDRP